jgi:carbon-monoxide dehydrogenase small subunit
MKITLTINGNTKVYDIDAHLKLLDLLRNENFFSVKNCCSEGTCGSCTVLVNGKAIQSCILPAANVKDSVIETLEYFTQTEDFSDIQTGFTQAGVHLCGYCNPGKIFATWEIISSNSRPSREDIIKYMKCQKCRCTENETLIKGVILSAALRRSRIGAMKNV